VINKWYEFWLWKKFGLNRCEICNKLTFIQYEVGLGYWCCSDNTCLEKAGEYSMNDYYAWSDEKSCGTFDFSRKTIIEYK
jgi:hypothetical protein